MGEILNLSDAITLGQIIAAVSANQRVGWIPGRAVDGEWVPDGIARDPAKPIIGFARHICHDDSGASFLRDDEDVRDGFVRITRANGLGEVFLPVRDVMIMYRSGHMVLNYVSPS